MLHYQAVEPALLALLKKLMAVPLLQPMRLAGGTALALQTGHRKSVDLDLFGNLYPAETALLDALSTCGEVQWLNQSTSIKSLLINGIKTDIVSYRYPWLADMLLEDAIRLAHPADIAAMKLAAITGRGAKKDFIDLYFLLQIFSLPDMIGFYEKKYADGSVFLVLKSLVYFDDAEADAMPVMLQAVTWEMVKETIVAKHTAYLSSLS